MAAKKQQAAKTTSAPPPSKERIEQSFENRRKKELAAERRKAKSKLDKAWEEGFQAAVRTYANQSPAQDHVNYASTINASPIVDKIKSATPSDTDKSEVTRTRTVLERYIDKSKDLLRFKLEIYNRLGGVLQRLAGNSIEEIKRDFPDGSISAFTEMENISDFDEVLSTHFSQMVELLEAYV